METAKETTDMDLRLSKAIAAEQQSYQGMGIKILSIAGGLLGSGFLMGWIFLLLNDSAAVMLILGFITLTAAIYVDRKVSNTVLDTACIGAYLAACAMIGSGLETFYSSDNITTVVLLCIALAVPFFTRAYMFNFLSVVIVNGCLYALININNVHDLVHLQVALTALVYAWLCLNEAKCLASGEWMNRVYNPWRIGLLCVLLALLTYLAIGGFGTQKFGREWLSSAGIIGIILFFLHHIISDLKIEKQRNRILIYLLVILVLLPACFAPAVCGALLIIMLSFHTGYKPGLILGILALVYFSGQYYYNLHYTLLVKSEIMLATGALFILAWFVLKKTLKRYE